MAFDGGDNFNATLFGANDGLEDPEDRDTKPKGKPAGAPRLPSASSTPSLNLNVAGTTIVQKDALTSDEEEKQTKVAAVTQQPVAKPAGTSRSTPSLGLNVAGPTSVETVQEDASSSNDEEEEGEQTKVAAVTKQPKWKWKRKEVPKHELVRLRARIHAKDPDVNGKYIDVGGVVKKLPVSKKDGPVWKWMSEEGKTKAAVEVLYVNREAWIHMKNLSFKQKFLRHLNFTLDMNVNNFFAWYENEYGESFFDALHRLAPWGFDGGQPPNLPFQVASHGMPSNTTMAWPQHPCQPFMSASGPFQQQQYQARPGLVPQFIQHPRQAMRPPSAAMLQTSNLSNELRKELVQMLTEESTGASAQNK
jgi:hypothetical protein